MTDTIGVWTVIMLLVIHYVADFVFQTDWQAVNKSKNNRALATHVGTYSIPFLVLGLPFWAITFVTHFVTDYFTSRLVAHFNKKEMRGAMFMTIGFDQLVHGVTLVLTYAVLNTHGLIIYPI